MKNVLAEEPDNLLILRYSAEPMGKIKSIGVTGIAEGRTMKTFTTARNQKGSLGSLLILSLVTISLVVGSLAVDMAHINAVQTELQNAVDSAALAGAQDLVTDPGMADMHALEVAAQNRADGKPVSNTTPNTTVVTQQYASALPGNAGTMEVTATMQIDNILAKLFGRNTETLTARSLAGCSSSISQVGPNRAFPLTVSIDTVPAGRNADKTPIWKKKVGDDIDMYINSQQYNNAAFTSFTTGSANANYLKDAISQMLGTSPMQPGTIPPVNVGDQISLIDGVAAQKHLADQKQLSKLSEEPVWIIPVISGDPPFNQKRGVIGFIGVKIKSIKINGGGGQVETITGTLVKPLTRGRAGEPNSGNSNIDRALEDLSPNVVRLVSSVL